MGPDRLRLIRQRLVAGELPGEPAQQRLGHAFRREYSVAPPTARQASVLALFYPVGDRIFLLFIQRTSPPGDRHAGQISFPGGSADPGDVDAAHTALREAEEEVGVDPLSVEILGELTPLYIPVSNFSVSPFVGYTASRPTFLLQESEVARILELPFEAFYREDAIENREKRLINGMVLKDVPHWVVGEESVWGATAMMLSELVELGRV